MTYDPIDTNETDSTADRKISIETINEFGVAEVATFSDLPTVGPPQLAFVTDESEYYHSEPISGTPFDIASATFSKSINTQDSGPTGMAFSADGSRLYEVGSGGDKIYQSQVSTGGWIAF